MAAMHQTSSPDLQPRRPSAPAAAATPPLLRVGWAAEEQELRAAQRLRYRVFVEEMGARPVMPAGTPAGHDADRFDPHCEHLLAWGRRDPALPWQVVGTYRVLTPAGRQHAGASYSAQEFDLDALQALWPATAELGRACIDPRWRNGAVILALWNALVLFFRRQRIQTLLGCASVGIGDGGHAAASLYARLQATHLAPAQWRARPRLPLPIDQLRTDLAVDTPPLIKAYLRCGALVLGPPARDADFNTADIPLLLRTAALPGRFGRAAA